ncbi:GNAT family N-acetyltransferase [Variovorax ginsengisoli]|uniref:GNAT family N-acetyltransferase n=2 Tax=Variovorax ginsengisoli TaxID=363844 RepID=A0ABT8SG51_9BURK|nr:GNAT family N-acetyltransferase [Variovorax ginsengisoli]MDN8618741.1 GNAT family N-acetyltransferase [Variovorax ginsengisoli]MDO1537911.1 GNAT family N-acetyltransferase [Variovorax ginsengisoli]
MHFHFRRAGEEDAPAVRSLSRAAYAKWVPVIGREPLPMKANYEAAVREHLIDLLEVDGMLAALVEMIPESEWLLIENLAVAPTFQRRGCARILLERAQETALALRLKGLRLFTNKLFESNVDLYLRYAFAIDREEPFMGGITVYMSKSLTA